MKKSHIGEKFNFEKCGPYEIIRNLGYNNGKLRVQIKFLNTGTILEVQYNNAKNGKVKDPLKFIYDNKNKEFQSNYGPFKIIEDLGCDGKHKMIKIKFILTGFENIVQYNHAKDGLVYDPTYFMYTVKDKIFQSEYGPFKIIEDLGIINGSKMVKVKFILTGYEYIIQYNHAKTGLVKDPTYFMYTIKDKIFLSNNYGPFKIIEDLGNINNYKRVKIKFINTGSITIVRYDDAKNGEVSDPAFINAYNARNIIGPIEIQNIDRTLNSIWVGMMHRCYNEKDKTYNLYGAKGVTVSNEWHNFNIFKNDAQSLPGWQCKLMDPLNYHLDKDLFQFNLPYYERVYSKNTCVWLPASMNTSLNQYNIKIYYNHIYEIYGYYYIKNIDDIPNYGPFNDLESAVSMLYYCYKIFNIPNNILNNNFKYMDIKEIMNHTPDRKPIVRIVK